MRQKRVAVEDVWYLEKVKSEIRAGILFKAAAIIHCREHEFSALLVLVKEAGKPWNKADADTAEQIDFFECYGRQMLRMKDGMPVGRLLRQKYK